MIDSTGYVVGVMLGDGSFGRRPDGKHAYVKMNTKDEGFADKFAAALTEFVGSPIAVRAYKYPPSKRARTKFYYDVCKGMVAGIPRLKALMDYDYIRNAERKFKLGVVGGLFDSEGCLSGNNGGKHPRIEFGVCDLDLAKLWQDLCIELFELHVPIIGPSKAGQYRLTYYGMERCLKFFDEVPITIDRKRERWQQFLSGEIVRPWT